MDGRRQEKLGWIAGWLGGFVWVPMLAGVSFVRGNWIHGSAGLLLAGVACTAVPLLAPWRHSRTRYRVLMTPIYALLFIAIAWGLWVVGDPRMLGFKSASALLILLPTLIPLWTVGSRRWDERDV